jgi:hypothetical protein
MDALGTKTQTSLSTLAAQHIGTVLQFALEKQLDLALVCGSLATRCLRDYEDLVDAPFTNAIRDALGQGSRIRILVQAPLSKGNLSDEMRELITRVPTPADSRDSGSAEVSRHGSLQIRFTGRLEKHLRLPRCTCAYPRKSLGELAEADPGLFKLRVKSDTSTKSGGRSKETDSQLFEGSSAQELTRELLPRYELMFDSIVNPERPGA